MVGVDSVGVGGGRGVVQGAEGGPYSLGGGGGGGGDGGWAPSRVHCSWGSGREAAIRAHVGAGGARGNCCCPGEGSEASSTPCRGDNGGS
jgi:hypothetical protein